MLTGFHTLVFEATPDGAAPVGPVGEPVGETEAVPSDLEAALGQMEPAPGTEGAQQEPTIEQLAQALQEQRQMTQEMYEYLAAREEQITQPPPPAEAEPEAPQWDPYNPQAVGEYLNHQFGQVLDQRLQPLMPLLETFAESQGEQVANQQFDQIEQKIGPFDRDLALDRALWMIEEAQIPPAQAIQHAAQEQKAFEDKIRQEAVAAYEARLSGALDVEGEVPAGGAGAERQEPLPSGRGNSRAAYREQGRRSLARMNLRAVQ